MLVCEGSDEREKKLALSEGRVRFELVLSFGVGLLVRLDALDKSVCLLGSRLKTREKTPSGRSSREK